MGEIEDRGEAVVGAGCVREGSAAVAGNEIYDPEFSPQPPTTAAATTHTHPPLALT